MPARKPTKVELTELQRRGARPKKIVRAPDPAALLVTRQQASRILSISVSTLVRLEAAGRLTAIKLDPESAGMIHYRNSDVQRLARGDT